MRRVLFRFGTLDIYSYPAMLYAGIVLGIWAELYAASLVGVSVWRVLGATLVLLVIALLGARLLFVASRWATFRRDPSRLWRFSDGGASMYGGLLLAVPMAVPVLAVAGIPFGVFWDLATFTMLIGMIITRVGCLLNGCCSGRPTESRLGVHLPNDHGVRARRIPTQILEGAWGMALLGGAILLWSSVPFDGAIFAYALGGYGVGRIILEPTRDARDVVFGVRLQSALSTLWVVVALAILFAGRK